MNDVARGSYVTKKKERKTLKQEASQENTAAVIPLFLFSIQPHTHIYVRARVCALAESSKETEHKTGVLAVAVTGQ